MYNILRWLDFFPATDLYDFDDDDKVSVLLSPLPFLQYFLWLHSLDLNVVVFFPPFSCYCFFNLVKDGNKVDLKKLVSENWVEPPKRERKRKYGNSYVFFLAPLFFTCFIDILILSLNFSYSESQYFKQTLRPSAPAKPKEPRIPRMPQLWA